MTLPAPTYDLTLLLDPDAEEDARAKIVADARAAIEAGGELARYDEWGMRPLSYPIDRKSAAEYHLLQFHAQTPQLLSDLQRSLRITDGILRFRLIKLRPGVPTAPDMRASSPAVSHETSPPADAQPAEVDVVELEVLEVDAPEPESPPDGGGAEPGDASALLDAPAASEALGPEEAATEPASAGAAEPDGRRDRGRRGLASRRRSERARGNKILRCEPRIWATRR